MDNLNYLFCHVCGTKVDKKEIQRHEASCLKKTQHADFDHHGSSHPKAAENHGLCATCKTDASGKGKARKPATLSCCSCGETVTAVGTDCDSCNGTSSDPGNPAHSEETSTYGSGRNPQSRDNRRQSQQSYSNEQKDFSYDEDPGVNDDSRTRRCSDCQKNLQDDVINPTMERGQTRFPEAVLVDEEDEPNTPAAHISNRTQSPTKPNAGRSKAKSSPTKSSPTRFPEPVLVDDKKSRHPPPKSHDNYHTSEDQSSSRPDSVRFSPRQSPRRTDSARISPRQSPQRPESVRSSPRQSPQKPRFIPSGSPPTRRSPTRPSVASEDVSPRRFSREMEFCGTCNRDIPSTRMDDHQQNVHPPTLSKSGSKWKPPEPEERDPRQAAPRKAQSAVGPANRFIFCYICGNMFGSKSIRIHEPQCLKKWRIQNDQLPRHLRRPEPKKPEPIRPAGQWSYDDRPLRGSSAPFDVHPEHDMAWQSHLQNLVPCTYCRRTFFPDRIMKHESACIERPKKRHYSDVPAEIPR